jgi:hypothetical protein
MFLKMIAIITGFSRLVYITVLVFKISQDWYVNITFLKIGTLTSLKHFSSSWKTKQDFSRLVYFSKIGTE